MEALQNKQAVQVQKILNNAEEIKNTRNDLNSWVKVVKDKEQKLSVENNSEHVKSQPIRSHISKIEKKELKSIGDVLTEHKQRYETEGEREERNDKADIYKDCGNNHVKEGDYADAIDQYTMAINIYGEDPKYFTNRALCFLRLKRYAECVDDCNRAIEIDILNVKAYYRRMQANEFLNFNTQALKDCTTVLMIDPKNREAKISLQRINQRLKKTGAVPKGYAINEPTNFKEGPNFSPLRSNMIEILPVTKLSNARSKKQLKPIQIIDVIGPKDGKNYENSNIQISDEVIDKLFNGECGSYEEVKKSDVKNVEKDSNKIAQRKSAAQITNEANFESEIASLAKNSWFDNLYTKKPLPPAPTSTSQFYCTWKELSAEQKYQYFKSIQISHINKILGAGFDSETLTSLLTMFNEFYISNEDNLCETLVEICKHNRLKILSLMLSAEDKTALAYVLNNIRNKASVADLCLISDSFNLKSISN